MQTVNTSEVDQTNQMGIMKRILNIFFEPVKVFRSVAEKPKVLIPLIILMFSFAILAVPTAPIMEDYTKQTNEKLYKNEKFLSTQKAVTKDNADELIEQNAKFVRILSYASPVIVMIVMLLQAAIFLGAFKVLGGKGSFSQTFAVLVYSYFISLLGEVVRVINIVVSGKADITNSIALFMQDDKTNFLYNFFYSMDLFGLWAFIVAAVGFSIVHQASMKKAFICVFSLCMLFVIVASLNATIQSVNLFNQYGITM